MNHLLQPLLILSICCFEVQSITSLTSESTNTHVRVSSQPTATVTTNEISSRHSQTMQSTIGNHSTQLSTTQSNNSNHATQYPTVQSTDDNSTDQLSRQSTVESPTTQPPTAQTTDDNSTDQFNGQSTDESPTTQPPTAQTTDDNFTNQFSGQSTDESPITQPPTAQTTDNNFTNQFSGQSTDESPTTQPPTAQTTDDNFTNQFSGQSTDESPTTQPPTAQSTDDNFTNQFSGQSTDESPTTQPPTAQTTDDNSTDQFSGQSTDESPKTQTPTAQTTDNNFTDQISGQSTDESPKTQPPTAQTTDDNSTDQINGQSTDGSPITQPSTEQSNKEKFTTHLPIAQSTNGSPTKQISAVQPTNKSQITPTLTDTSTNKSSITSTNSTNKTHAIESSAASPVPTAESTVPNKIPNTNNNTIEIRKLPIPFKVEVNLTFDKELLDNTSNVYRNISTVFKRTLEKSFKAVKGFCYVIVKEFRKGSIICDYEAVFVNITNVSTLTTEMQTVQKRVKETPILSVKPTVSEDMVTQFKQATSNLCKVTQKSCGVGQVCSDSNGKPVCTPVCESQRDKCQHNGRCFFDIKTSKTDCRCVEDDKFSYSGRYCENKAEKLALSSTNIIIISASAGGGSIVILLIIIVILIVKRGRRNDRKQPIDDNFDKHRSVSMNELNMDRWSNPSMPRSHGNTVQNEYQSGLPETRYLSGREHMVVKDDMGAETYLYKPTKQSSRPSSMAPSDIDTRSERAGSTYDYIDTEVNYQIKRPSVKMGYLNNI